MIDILRNMSQLCLIFCLFSLSPFLVAQQELDSSLPNTKNGFPDLQGTWDFRTITPFQRPDDIDAAEFGSPEEAAAFERAEVERRNRDNFTEESQTGDYNDFWYDRGSELVDNRTSLITDPASGRIPPLTAEAQARQREAAAAREASIGVEARPLSERCILGFNSGPPMLPSAYNNIVQFVQTPDYFVIHNEMVHNARIVRMNAEEHVDFPQKWEGDSIGYWEEDTLVVQTDNFLHETTFPGSSENMRLTERFRLIDADTLRYAFTIEDDTTWVQPWSVMFDMRRTDEPIYEYACHEGNYSLPGILGGFRREEQK